MNGIQQYLNAIEAQQKRVIQGQQALLQQVATAMAQTIRGDGRIFTFGTGHSHMLAEEGFYRAGGLAPVTPLLLSSLMLHESALLSGDIERTPGLAEPLLKRYRPQPGELIFIFSNSGVNQMPVEMAQVAKKEELTVVSVSSLAYARVAPLSAVGQRLDQLANYTIDNGGPPGDSLVSIEGLPWPVGPGSTVVGGLIWNALVVETVRQLHQSGDEVPVIASANMSGALDHNQKLLRRWRGRNPHL